MADRKFDPGTCEEVRSNYVCLGMLPSELIAERRRLVKKIKQNEQILRELPKELKKRRLSLEAEIDRDELVVHVLNEIIEEVFEDEEVY